MAHSVDLVHCDIKGDNIKATMDLDGSNPFAVVIDFGCSQKRGASKSTHVCDISMTWERRHAQHICSPY